MTMELDKALKLVAIEYESAKKLEHIRNPLAYALYKVWKLADAKEPKQPTDLRGKCGGCAYGKVAENVYGGSKCFIECTNADKIARSPKGRVIRKRSLGNCRFYKERTE
jgi:hypothetical protein